MNFVLPAASPLPDSYDVVACSQCGFVYADTQGSHAAYARHYAEFSLYEDPAASTGSGHSDEDRQRFAAMASLFGQHIPRAARILDIGCGGGGLLLALRSHGFENLVGMDPSPRCISFLHQNGLRGTPGTLDAIPESIGTFDLVILSHVVEHLLDPATALASVRMILGENGGIYVETPDASRYSASSFVPFYFFDIEHINHFDPPSLANLARVSGLAVDSIASREIAVAGGRPYPVVHMLCSRSSADANAASPAAGNSRAMMARYIAECADRIGEFSRIEKSISPAAPLAIWGAGSFAQRFLELPWMKTRRIVAVVDRDGRKQGQRFAGCTIAAPDAGLRDLPEATTILLLVALDAETAERQYRELGLPYAYRICAKPPPATGADLLA